MLAGPGVPVMPVVKADAYGHGAVPVALALEAAGVDGLCVAAVDEALALRGGRRPCPDPRALPGPGRLRGRGRPARHRARGRRRGGPGGDAGGRGGPRRGDGRCGSSWRSRRGSDEAASCRPRLPSAAGRMAAATRRRAARRVDAFPGGRGRAGHGRAGRPLRGGAGEHRGGRDPLPARHLAASAALLTGRAAGLRRRPSRAGDLRPRARRARPRDRRAGAARLRPAMALYARPVRVADLPSGMGDQLRADVPDDAPEPDRDAPARLRGRLVASAVEPGAGRSCAACACRSSGTWPWTP